MHNFQCLTILNKIFKQKNDQVSEQHVKIIKCQNSMSLCNANASNMLSDPSNVLLGLVSKVHSCFNSMTSKRVKWKCNKHVTTQVRNEGVVDQFFGHCDCLRLFQWFENKQVTCKKNPGWNNAEQQLGAHLFHTAAFLWCFVLKLCCQTMQTVTACIQSC